jgi:hypothetical protein
LKWCTIGEEVQVKREVSWQPWLDFSLLLQKNLVTCQELIQKGFQGPKVVNHLVLLQVACGNLNNVALELQGVFKNIL